MKKGQTYITDKGNTMKVLFVNGSGERARVIIGDTECDVIVSKCSSYKLIDTDKEEAKLAFIKKFKLSKAQIKYLTLINADREGEIKNWLNTYDAMRHKGVNIKEDCKLF